MFKTETSPTSQRDDLFSQDDATKDPVNAINSSRATVSVSKEAHSDAFLRRQWRRRRVSRSTA
ncbi:MAG: hypothetical protein AAFZ91_08975 [Pseudomonadota bacterium]